MSALVVNTGEIRAIDVLKTMVLYIFLYTNDKSPDDEDVTADYEYATDQGLVQQSIYWDGPPVTRVDGKAEQVATPNEWTFAPTSSAPITVFGYAIIDASDGTLVAAERIPGGAVTFAVAGDKLRLQVKMTVANDPA